MAESHRTFSHPQFQDLTGQTIASLTFVRPLGKNRWLCRCKCGAEKEVQADNVKRGRTTSCGCEREKWLAEKTGSGPSRQLRREYFTLKNMLRRCAADSEPEYSSYKAKAKGISVCERWAKSLDAFVQDMGRHPGAGYTIERIDNNKGYEPGNCVWATRSTQARNTRQNRRITFNGETLVATDWAERTGISARTICWRIDRGWSVERALT